MFLGFFASAECLARSAQFAQDTPLGLRQTVSSSGGRRGAYRGFFKCVDALAFTHNSAKGTSGPDAGGADQALILCGVYWIPASRLLMASFIRCRNIS